MTAILNFRNFALNLILIKKKSFWYICPSNADMAHNKNFETVKKVLTQKLRESTKILRNGNISNNNQFIFKKQIAKHFLPYMMSYKSSQCPLKRRR